MLDLATILAVGLTLGLSTALTILITVPLYGALVRFRANYAPRGIALDDAGEAQPHVGPVVPGFFKMLYRVKRIEGFAGLYKGIMPMLIGALVVGILAALWMGALVLLGGDIKGPFPMGSQALLLVYTSVVAIITLPINVIINRAIVTPYKLPTWNARASLAVLLSPYEQSRPWILYFTPGLLAAQVAHTLYNVLVLHFARRWLIPSSFQINALIDPTIPERPEWPEDFTPLRISAFIVISMLSTLVLCPLEVMATRLSVQRNYARSSTGAISLSPSSEETVVDAANELPYISTIEEVIGVRSDAEPYTGLVDCARKMGAEEGTRVLYRGWWLTMLGLSSTLN